MNHPNKTGGIMDTVTNTQCLCPNCREQLATRLLEQAAINAKTDDIHEVMHHFGLLLDRPGMPDLQTLLDGPRSRIQRRALNRKKCRGHRDRRLNP